MPGTYFPLSLLPFIITTNSLFSPTTQTLDQQKICTYDFTLKMVMCSCSGSEDNSRLNLQWGLFQPEVVSDVVIDSCTSLHLSLDLSMVSLVNVTVQIRHIGVVTIGDIKSHQHQHIHIAMEDVEKTAIENQIVDKNLKLSYHNVSSVLLYKTFLDNLTISAYNVDKFSMVDSVINNTAPGSVSLDSVKEVEIVNNQFNIDTIELLDIKDCHGLYISCNHLLGGSVSMECANISSTLTTMSSLVETNPVYNLHQDETIVTNNPVLWLIVVGGLAMLVIIILCFFFRRANNKQEDVEETGVLNRNIETERLEDENNDEEEFQDKMLVDKIDILKEGSQDDIDIIVEKIKEQEAILHDEIRGLNIKC